MTYTHIPRILTVSEIKRIFDRIPTDREGIRNRAMLEMLYGSGLRAAELLAIRFTDIDSVARRLIVRGKGNRQRVVPVTARAIAAIKVYWSNERKFLYKRDPKQTTLFLNVFGCPLGTSYLRLICAQYARSAGITKQSSPHVYRHSFATHLVERGADVAVVKELLGHAWLDTTSIYVHVAQTRVTKTFNDMHPFSSD